MFPWTPKMQLQFLKLLPTNFAGISTIFSSKSQIVYEIVSFTTYVPQKYSSGQVDRSFDKPVQTLLPGGPHFSFISPTEWRIWDCFWGTLRFHNVQFDTESAGVTTLPQKSRQKSKKTSPTVRNQLQSCMCYKKNSFSSKWSPGHLQ